VGWWLVATAPPAVIYIILQVAGLQPASHNILTAFFPFIIIVREFSSSHLIEGIYKEKT